jgi:hypothetical protein
MRKKGEMMSKELFDIVLAGVVVVLLIVLLFALIAPSFNRTEKTAESYFDSFLDAVAVADKGGTGSFSMWQKGEGVDFFLAYFGDKISFTDDRNSFDSVGINKNKACICYKEKEMKCTHCVNLKYPVRLGDNEEYVEFSFKVGDKIEIAKLRNENFYRFVKK